MYYQIIEKVLSWMDQMVTLIEPWATGPSGPLY
jgi:hypothetical protein